MTTEHIEPQPEAAHRHKSTARSNYCPSKDYRQGSEQPAGARAAQPRRRRKFQLKQRRMIWTIRRRGGTSGTVPHRTFDHATAFKPPHEVLTVRTIISWQP